MTGSMTYPLPAPAAEPGGRPIVVTLAFGLVVGTVLRGAAGLVIAVVQFGDPAFVDSVRGASSAGGADLPPDVTEGILSGTLIAVIGAAVALGVLDIALRLVFAVLMARGAGWARIVLTVLAGLVLIGSPFALLPRSVELPLETLGVALGLVGAVLNAAVVVLVWLPPSNAWFRAMRAARAPR